MNYTGLETAIHKHLKRSFIFSDASFLTLFTLFTTYCLFLSFFINDKRLLQGPFIIADAVLVIQLLRQRTHISHLFKTQIWFRSIFCFLFIAIAFLHIDYIYHRWFWIEEGWIGTLRIIQMSLIITTSTMLWHLWLSQVNRKQEFNSLYLTKKTLIYLCFGFVFLITAPLLKYYLINPEYFKNTREVGLYFGSMLLLPISFFVLASLTIKRAFVHYILILLTAIFALHLQLPALNAYLKVSSSSFVLPRVIIIVGSSVLLCAASLRETKTFLILATAILFLSGWDGYSSHIQQETQKKQITEVSKPNSTVAAKIESKGALPDIYLLVYDGYPNERAFSNYGIDNHQQFAMLRKEGFTIYPSAYTVYAATLGSMMRVFGMSDLPQKGIAEKNQALTRLRELGYQTELILSPYFYQNLKEVGADKIFPLPKQSSQLSMLFRGLAIGEFKSEFVFPESERSEWLEVKHSALADNPNKPKFVYTHSGFPSHSQTSGRCLDDETAQFEKRLHVANNEMNGDIKTIRRSNRKAIIIVASDHGPYLRGDCRYLTDRKTDDVDAKDLLDRYGVLLAINWPESIKPSQAEPRILQDIFYAVFESISDSPLPPRVSPSSIGYGPTLKNGIIAAGGKIMIGKDAGKAL